MADPIGVPELFVGRTVFLTGGSGFIGKVIIEKLLRSCSGIEKIYVLIRERRGKTIEERMDEIAKLPLFDKLHEEFPGDFAAKVIPLHGDVSSVNLGLSPEDRQLLVESVHIVYHVAATVKFDQAFSDAILMNVRGTREVCQLALEMRRAIMTVHVSTAYAHTQYNPIEEKMYPATADWRRCIQAAETMDAYELSLMQGHVLGPYPNTYTYTKGLGERVVFDLLDGKVPNMIIRPSIIISSWRDPIPGWIDNFNGPVGMLAANGTGLIRINLIKNQTCDFLPVDIAVRAFLNATWHRITQAENHGIPAKATSVHNCSANTFAKMTTYDVAQMAHDLAEECAISTCVWYPTLRRTENQTFFNFVFLFLHVLPALFYDVILRMLSYRPVVLKIQRRIFVAVNALKYFILNEWKIVNVSLYNIEAQLPAKDMKDFGYDADAVDHRLFFRDAMMGGLKYLLKEDMTKLEANRTRIRILKYVDIIFTMLFYLYLFNLFMFRWNVPGVVYDSLGNYFESLHIPLFFNS